MATIVASLMATIGGDASGLNKALAGAKGSLQKTGKEMGTFGGTVKDTILKLGGLAIAGGAAYKAVGSVVDFFKTSITDTMDYAKAVEDVGRFTGTSAREASKLLQIADDLRIPIEALKMGMKSAVREGVLPTIDGLKALAKEYQALPTDLQKSQFALEKFGRAGMEMQKFLELAPEQLEEMAQSAEDFGLVLNSQSIKAVHEFYLQLDDLNDQWAGIKMGVGQDAIPALSKLLTTLESLEKVGEKGGTKNLAQDWWELFLALSYGVGPTEDASRGLEELYNDSKDAGLIIGGVTKSFEDYALWGNKVFTASENMAEGVGGAVGQFLAFKAAAEDVKKAVENMFTGLAESGFDKFSKSMFESMRLMLDYRYVLGEIGQSTWEEGKAATYSAERLSYLNEGIESGAVSLQEYNDFIKDGKITATELGDAYEGLAEHGLGAVASNSVTAMNGIKDFGKAAKDTEGEATGAIGGITGAIGGITSAAGIAAGAIDGIGASISELPTHTTLTIDIIYNQQGRPVGIGGGDEFYTDKGVPYGAAGGPLMGNSPYIVGERGPELFVPNTSGNLIPNNKLGAVGGGDTYIINNNSTGAAALTMAIIQQSHRARLSRSMGG